MKHKKITIVAVIFVLAGSIIWWGLSQNKSSGGPQTIKGRVTSVSNECLADGVCSVTLDNSKVIVTGCGLMADGKTCKSYDQSKLIQGQQIEATVMMGEAGRYNLECEPCTLRVVE